MSFFPTCGFSCYPKYTLTEVNQQVVDGNLWPFDWNEARLPGNFNDYGLYLAPNLSINVDGQPSQYVDGADFGDSTNPMPWVIYAADFPRAIVRSSWDPVMVHVAPRHFSEQPIYASDDPYYNEAIIHILLSQQQPNLLYFDLEDSGDMAADEALLNGIMTLVQSQCLSATTIHSITKQHVHYNASYLASAVYLNDTHSGVARVTFAPGVDSVTFTLRGLEFPTERDGDELGAWVNFGPILHYDNWSFDQANAFTFDQVNILNFGGTRVMTLDDANALDLDQANALFE